MGDDVVDVVVVGAGPVGLTTALKLAKRGWRVHCVERQNDPYGLPRAVGLDSEAMRTLQGIGVADEQLSISGPGGDYTWRNGEGQVLLLYPPSVGAAGWPGVTFCQPEAEALLERHAKAHPLITVTRGVEAVGLDEDADGVTIRLQRTGTSESGGDVRGRYVVGCDGAHSIVRAHMGSGIEDLGFFYDWYIVDVIPDGPTEYGIELIQVCSPERPTTLVPGGPGRRRWEFMLLPGESKVGFDTEENAWRLLEPWGITPDNAKLERRALYTFQARWAQTWNNGRALIAGDAAHLMPPFAAQGLNSGLRDAENLAWKLDLVLSGKSPSSLLDSYTIERGEHVRHAIGLSIELGKVICILDPEQAAARDAAMLPFAGDPDAALPPVPEAAFRGGVVRHDAAGQPVAPGGTPAPQFEVRGRDRSGLFDDVFGPGITLLVRDEVPASSTVERFASLRGRIVRLLEAGSTPEASHEAEDVTGGYLAELDRLGARAGLYRPDGYWFGVAATVEEVPALVDEFVHALSAPATAGATR